MGGSAARAAGTERVQQHLVKSFRQGTGVTNVQIHEVVQFVMESFFTVWCNQSQI